MIGRAAFVIVLLVAAGTLSQRAMVAEANVPRLALAELPTTLGEWSGQSATALSDDVLGLLGVDDYINRRYTRPGDAPIGLYVGYYDSQRQGDTIHSPQNCLPGAGWRPVSSGRLDIDANGRTLTVNRYVIQKGLDRQVVLYWYQGRGRVVANEYANKALLMLDAARLQRTNGGLVRVLTPVTTTLEAAERNVAAFAAALFPHLEKHLP